MRLSARLFFLALIVAFSSFFAVSPSFAQTNTQNFYKLSNVNSDVPQNLHTYTQVVTVETLSAVMCQLAGIDPMTPTGQCLGYDPKTGKIGYVKSGGGAIGMMGGLIAMTFTPPIHFSDYTTYLASNFGVVKSAHAQGIGSQGISALAKLWQKFAEIVYLLFVIAFVLVGLAIMLRVKIDPRTVMTIENQIPRLIIALILVTFSFAIAGLLIDLMYVIVYLIMNVMASADPQLQGNMTKVTASLNTHPIGFFNELFSDFGNKPFGGVLNVAGAAGASLQRSIAAIFAPQGLKEFLPGEFGGNLPNPAQCDIKNPLNSIGCLLGEQLGGSIGKTMSYITGWLISYVVGILAILVITIALLWALFRLWFELIRSYVMILVDIVTAPFWIITGLLPGGGPGFGGWFRDMIAHLSAFPVAITMLLIGRVFMDEFAADRTKLFTPPLIGNPGDPSGFGAFIGLGIILVVPQTVKMMEDLLKSPQFKYISSIGQAIGVGAGTPTNVAKSTAAAHHASRAAIWDVKKGGYVQGGLGGAVRSLLHI